MRTLKPVDAAIVGGGWSGLLMAKELATRTGLEIVVLERGAARKPSDYAVDMDELDYSVRNKMMHNPALLTVTHRHSMKDRAAPIRQYGSFKPGTGTGGAGEHWGGNADRYLPELFTLKSHLREKHGKLADDLLVEDWGFNWDEIENDFWRAEQLMGISGQAGNIRGKIIEGGNIFEGPRSHDYPTPPGKKTWAGEMFYKAAVELGMHPYPQPTANMSTDYTNPDGISRPGCVYCGFCSGYACMIGARAQPTNVLMPILRRRKNFSIRNNACVRRIIHRDGRAAGVTYMDEHGEEVMQPAGVVILSAWATHNVRLLMLSKIGELYDPVTNKGLLGKNLTHQVITSTRAWLVTKERMNGFMNNSGLGYRISDFDGSAGIKPSDGILRGGTFTRGGLAADLPILSFGYLPPEIAPRNWGSKWKTESVRLYDRMMGGCSFRGDHLPWRQNYMDLDPTYTDMYSDPLLRMTLDWTDHEIRQMEFGERVGMQIAEAYARSSGAKLYTEAGPSDERRQQLAAPVSRRRYSSANYNTTHIQGGAIMGSSPATSVLNPWMQHWQVPNLWVLGSSAFPQNSSGNPTVSILGTTYRAADALIDRYLKHPGALA
jgi:gluconate 2-dehydrogenase alpha chain